jgi:nucleosome binding factor SPN SPT16 subunit
MVLVHINRKNPNKNGKKKQENVQFFTEVVEASEQVDGNKRSMYDPDEMDDEQRQRQLRKKLNEAFKEVSPSEVRAVQHTRVGVR